MWNIRENFIEYDGLCREVYNLSSKYFEKSITNSYFDEYLSICEISKVVVNNEILERKVIKSKNRDCIVIHFLLNIQVLYVSNYELEKLNELNLQEYYSVLVPLEDCSIDNELTYIRDYITGIKTTKIDNNTLSYYINILIDYKVPS